MCGIWRNGSRLIPPIFQRSSGISKARDSSPQKQVDARSIFVSTENIPSLLRPVGSSKKPSEQVLSSRNPSSALTEYKRLIFTALLPGTSRTLLATLMSW